MTSKASTTLSITKAREEALGEPVSPLERRDYRTRLTVHPSSLWARIEADPLVSSEDREWFRAMYGPDSKRAPGEVLPFPIPRVN
jgi:hypothetical protein